MTRDFNKQRRERNDMRPYVRKQPPQRPGEEDFERPARPRLNRETVDRAWENGAQVNHADYHPRSNSSQPRSGRPYNQRQRTSGQSDRNSSGYRRNYPPTEREREENERRNDRYNYRNPGPRSRPYNNERSEEPRPNNYRERNQYERPDARRTDRDHTYGNERSSHRNEQGHGYAGRPTRYPERETRPSTYNGRGQRPYGPPQRNNYRQNEREQFEGDYERFNSSENQTERRQTGARRYERRQPEERHVTRLPDGRVLKGPRPAQRKNAQFWTEIADDTNTLVPQASEEEREQKPTARKREKKAGTEPKSGNAVPRPSQRGFKWPKPEADSDSDQ